LVVSTRQWPLCSEIGRTSPGFWQPDRPPWAVFGRFGQFGHFGHQDCLAFARELVVSDLRFTLPEIARAARRWLAPEPLEKLLLELNGEEEKEPKLAPARATDRERNRAYEKLRSLGKLHR
jgi:hypothetical protein